jgi:hypothetical protein
LRIVPSVRFSGELSLWQSTPLSRPSRRKGVGRTRLSAAFDFL